MIAALQPNPFYIVSKYHPLKKQSDKHTQPDCPDETTISSWEYVDEYIPYANSQLRRVLVNNQRYLFIFG